LYGFLDIVITYFIKYEFDEIEWVFMYCMM